MPVLSICNHKGGTGKTTTAIHMAAAFGLRGHRVLAVDLDPQGFLTRLLGVEEPAEARSSLALFDHESDLRAIETVALHGFDLLPASYSMTKAARKLGRPTDVLWVKEALEQGHDYDLILLFGILGGESPEGKVALLRNCYQALTPGGALAIRGFAAGEPARDLEDALFSLHLLLFTAAGDSPTLSELYDSLQTAGFRRPQIVPLPDWLDAQLLVAHKPT